MICAICGKEESRRLKTESWKSDDGIVIEVPRGVEISALDPRNPDDKIICEDCYQKGLLSKYREDELHEIHTQFGLDYRMAGQMGEAELAFRRALKIKVTADSLSNLALAISGSDREQARKLYLMALDLEPNHFMALSNLKQLAE
jgi:tetratricopeptide (TPR) repeat protein